MQSLSLMLALHKVAHMDLSDTSKRVPCMSPGAQVVQPNARSYPFREPSKAGKGVSRCRGVRKHRSEEDEVPAEVGSGHTTRVPTRKYTKRRWSLASERALNASVLEFFSHQPTESSSAEGFDMRRTTLPHIGLTGMGQAHRGRVDGQARHEFHRT
ncbi:hypothetical protein VTK56DRAFT_7636 [Thermocarpiscus australiensis]